MDPCPIVKLSPGLDQQFKPKGLRALNPELNLNNLPTDSYKIYYRHNSNTQAYFIYESKALK